MPVAPRPGPLNSVHLSEHEESRYTCAASHHHVCTVRQHKRCVPPAALGHHCLGTGVLAPPASAQRQRQGSGASGTRKSMPGLGPAACRQGSQPSSECSKCMSYAPNGPMHVLCTKCMSYAPNACPMHQMHVLCTECMS